MLEQAATLNAAALIHLADRRGDERPRLDIEAAADTDHAVPSAKAALAAMTAEAEALGLYDEKVGRFRLRLARVARVAR